MPNRVLRQFGLNQPIPEARLMDRFKELHKMDRRGRANNDWVSTHRTYIDIWANRHSLIEAGDVVENPTYPSSEYITWYKPRTVMYIFNPSRQNTFAEGFQGTGSTTEYLV